MYIFREPRVEITKTVNGGDAWLVSGSVTFAIGQGDALDAQIKVDFQFARSEAQAIQMAAARLKQLAEMFSQQASERLGR